MIFLGSSMVFAADKLSVTNNIDTGIIDIELNEYSRLENGDLVPWGDGATILPGMSISKIPRVSNIGYDCYVRAKLEFSEEDLGISYINVGENWVQCNDGYWYYTEILRNKEYTDIFQGIKIPDDFNQELEGETLQLKVDVDAIQVNNFIPDYTSDTPWGSVEIQNCIHKGPHTVQELVVSNPKLFEIQYDNGSKNLIKNENDFFTNIPTLFPGDVFTDTLKLSNESTEKINLYFSTFSQSSDLLSKIKLKIALRDENSEKVIYEGSSDSKKLEEDFLLSTIESGVSKELVYTLEVPTELNNQYTLLEDNVRWMFRVESLEHNSDSLLDDIIHRNNPKTGDLVSEYICLLLMFISGSIILLLGIKNQKRKY